MNQNKISNSFPKVYFHILQIMTYSHSATPTLLPQPMDWKQASITFRDSGIWPLYKVSEEIECPKKKRSGPSARKFVVGGGEECEGFCNGPLPAGQTFLFKMRAFTEEEDLGGTDTNFSLVATRPEKPIIKTANLDLSGTKLTLELEEPSFYANYIEVRVNLQNGDKNMTKTYKSLEFENSILRDEYDSLAQFSTYNITVVAILKDLELVSEEESKLIYTMGITVIIAVVVMMILVLILVIALVMVKRYRPEALSSIVSKIQQRTRRTSQEPVTIELDDTRGQGPSPDNVVITSIPIVLSDFEREYHRLCRDSNLEFSRQFEDLKEVGIHESKKEANRQENRVKNR